VHELIAWELDEYPYRDSAMGLRERSSRNRFMEAARFSKSLNFASGGFCVMDTIALIVCYRGECIEFLPS